MFEVGKREVATFSKQMYRWKNCDRQAIKERTRYSRKDRDRMTGMRRSFERRTSSLYLSPSIHSSRVCRGGASKPLLSILQHFIADAVVDCDDVLVNDPNDRSGSSGSSLASTGVNSNIVESEVPVLHERFSPLLHYDMNLVIDVKVNFNGWYWCAGM
ncbi:hypothetical protein C8R42DRAFT_713178 [Lentinula raphanica]|nr:hypothetical protein C8R42DRAFT_713178 [Lentinula raphanica]